MNYENNLSANQKADFLEKYKTLLRFKSVSADDAFDSDLRACANWLSDYMTKLGGRVEQIKDYGRPVIFADFFVNDALPTIVIYGHYDVQPAADVELWHGDPFEPLIKNDKLFARGATDDKGPIMMALSAIEILKAKGPLPINIKILLEGEEESTGEALSEFIKNQTDRLKCDLVLCTDVSSFAPDSAAINYSTRGLVYKQIEVTGPSHDLHSGSFGGPVQSASNALTLILAGLFKPNGEINIPGIYDSVLPISPEERSAFAKLPFDLKRYKDYVGSNELIAEQDFTTLEQNWCRPCLTINGLLSGYTDPGPKTVLPSKAMAKISMRLVPNQSPTEISELMDKRINELCPKGVKLTIETLGTAEPFLGLREGAAVEAADEASLKIYGKHLDLTREGGTIPILTDFATHLTPKVLNLGLTGTECNTHGPNENISLDMFYKGIEMNCELFVRLANKNS